MAYLFWIIVGLFIGYILPVSWHQKFRNWFMAWWTKKAKPKVVKKVDISEDEIAPKEKIAKEIKIADETTEL